MRPKLFTFFEIFGYFGLLFFVAWYLLTLNMGWILDLFPPSQPGTGGFAGLALLIFGSPILGLLLTLPSYYYLRRYRKLSLAIAITGLIPTFLIIIWLLSFTILSPLSHFLLDPFFNYFL